MVGGNRRGFDPGGLDRRRGHRGIDDAVVLGSLLSHWFAHSSNTPLWIDLLVTFIACEILTSGPAYRNFRESSGAELGRERGTGVAGVEEILKGRRRKGAETARGAAPPRATTGGGEAR